VLDERVANEFNRSRDHRLPTPEARTA